MGEPVTSVYDDTHYRVYATHANGSRVVRKILSGEWWIESPLGRKRVHFHEAVEFAKRLRTDGGEIKFGVRGGEAFDRAVLRARIPRPGRLTG